MKENADLASDVDKATAPILMVASAPTDEMLGALVDELRNYLENDSSAPLAGIASSLSKAGSEGVFRFAFLSNGREEAVQILSTTDPQTLFSGEVAGAKPVIFMFPGGGAQYAGMAAGLYAMAPVFQQWVDTCSEILLPLIGFDLRGTLFPADDEITEAAERIIRPLAALPALFVTEYSLARLLISWGITPQAMIGHSLGEYVAACISGVLTLEDALALVAARARLLNTLSPGAMMSVPMSEAELAQWLDHDLSIAAINDPSMCVVAGSVAAIDRLGQRFQLAGIETRKLRIAAAGHCAELDPILDEFTNFAAAFQPKRPQIPYISNITGRWMTPEDATDPFYWTRHLRQTVRFADGINLLLQGPECIFLEIGPGQILSSLVKRRIKHEPEGKVFSSLRRFQEAQSDIDVLTKTVGRLWVAGVAVDWPAFFSQDQAQPVVLPKQISDLLTAETGATASIGLRARMAAAYIPPESETEKIIAGIWCDLLGRERVGIRDSFFELGGHSLLGTQLLSRLRECFEVELPLRALFEGPTIEGLARRLAEEGPSMDTAPASRPRALERNGQAPLSYPQQGLWLLSRLSPNDTAYNIVRSYRLNGPLDREALKRSVNEIVRRHESLRTRIVEQQGEGLQRIAPTLELELPYEDLSALDAGACQARIDGVVTWEAGEPFDLSEGPLMRLRLLRKSAQEHLLILCVHHIVFDGWSLRIWLRELASLYEAYSRGEDSPLGPLKTQYGDYAVWQRERISGDRLETGLTYWRDRLAGVPDLLELPGDHARPRTPSRLGGRYAFSLDRELCEGLRRLCQGQGVTLYMVLLAAYQALLSRYTGQRDIVVGSPTAGRGELSLEEQIGLFVNMVVMRTDLGGNPEFEELLKRVKETTLGAFAHQETPFEKLVEDLQPGRELSHTPIFQFVFALQPLPINEVRMGEVELKKIDTQSERSKYDLSLFVAESGQSLECWAEYSLDLYEGETIERMMKHLEKVLRSVVQESRTRVNDLPLLSEEEERELREWSQGREERFGPGTVVDLVEREAERRKQKLAVSWGKQQMSYESLNRRSNEVANYLLGRGLKREEVVGICSERSGELLLGALGVMKAGGAYLPLDPATPPQRLEWMLRNAGVRVMLTTSRQKGKLIELGVDLLSLDEEAERLSRENGSNPGVELWSEGLAYVIYTSGSTGRPKGVGVTHGGLRNLVEWHRRQYEVKSEDRATLVAGPGFDASVWEAWPYLSTGGSLHIPEEEEVLSPGGLRRYLSEEGITLSFLPTPLAEALLEGGIREGWPEKQSLRGVLTGGDKLHRMEGEWPFRLYNNYGPTENTVVATMGETKGGLEEGQSPTIGRGIDNVKVYVLDKEGRLSPVGVAGEIWIGGASLARGYINQAEETASRFLPDGVSGERGGRLYRTGDLGRYLRTGEIEFLGRKDQQVKIRGYRIELSEIEAVLSSHPLVQESVVVLYQGPGAEKQLVAYVTSDVPKELSALELKAYLRDRLPDYMAPAIIYPIEKMPLTTNGKIDRRSLPDPSTLLTTSSATTALPQTEMEMMIEQAWRSVLNLKMIGVDENFFDLGGHSLAMAKVFDILKSNSLHDSKLAGLQLVDLFEYPTIETLASYLSQSVPVDEAGGKIQKRAIDQRRAMRRRKRTPVEDTEIVD